jgi:hypothetical protein
MGDPPRFLLDLPLADLCGWWLRVVRRDRAVCLSLQIRGGHKAAVCGIGFRGGLYVCDIVR